MSLPPLAEDRRSRRFADGYDRVFAEVERTFLGPIRTRLVGQLTGRVAEIGAGTGANVRHYAAADHVTLVEPLQLARKAGHADVAPVALLGVTRGEVGDAAVVAGGSGTGRGVRLPRAQPRAWGEAARPDRDHAPDHQVCRWVSTRPRPRQGDRRAGGRAGRGGAGAVTAAGAAPSRMAPDRRPRHGPRPSRRSLRTDH